MLREALLSVAPDLAVTFAVLDSMITNERRLEAAGWRRYYCTVSTFPMWTHADYPHAVFSTASALRLLEGRH
jgi:hypothetical protein